MKKVIVGLVFLGIVAGSIGLYQFTKPVESTKTSKTDYKVNSVDLLSAFENDELSANKKYLDKVLEVKGSVQKIEVKDEKTTVYLDADNLLSSVIVQLEDRKSDIEIGQEVTLKGICTGYLMDVVLVRAIRV